MRVLIIGDVHGRHPELAETLRQARADFRIGAAIQVGDFGFTARNLARLREERTAFAVPLHVIDGNHEDHAWLRKALLTGAAASWRRHLNLHYQTRGSVARLGSSQVGFLGGALHVDQPQRHNLLSGFPNYIARRHRAAAMALFNREKPALLVTHSCPAGIGVGMAGAPGLEPGVAEHIASAGFDPGPPDDRGEVELTQLWHGLRYRPKAWAFGHFHRRHRVFLDGTCFVCADPDLSSPDRRLLLWDTEEQILLDCPPLR